MHRSIGRNFCQRWRVHLENRKRNGETVLKRIRCVICGAGCRLGRLQINDAKEAFVGGAVHGAQSVDCHQRLRALLLREKERNERTRLLRLFAALAAFCSSDEQRGDPPLTEREFCRLRQSSDKSHIEFFTVICDSNVILAQIFMTRLTKCFSAPVNFRRAQLLNALFTFLLSVQLLSL